MKKAEILKKRSRSWLGKNNPRWNLGKLVTSQGYIRVRVGSGKYRLEHRIVVEKKIGRKLLSHEHVDHINSNKQDNRPENLQVVSNRMNKLLDLRRHGHPLLGKKMSRKSIEKTRLSKLGIKASLLTRYKISISQKKIWEQRKNSCP